MQKDAELGRWIRPDDHVDDHFFAAMFLKVALRLWLYQSFEGLEVGTGYYGR